MLGTKDNLAHKQGETVTTTGGLCLTCNLSGSCIHNERGPIWHCEEFDDRTVATDRPVLRAAPAVETVAGKTVGICGNCGHRSTCTLPQADGGIWRCEEYL